LNIDKSIHSMLGLERQPFMSGVDPDCHESLMAVQALPLAVLDGAHCNSEGTIVLMMLILH